jgi:hypothetical protein
MISLSKFKSIKTPAIVSELSGFASLSVSHEKIVLIGLISDDVPTQTKAHYLVIVWKKHTF